MISNSPKLNDRKRTVVITQGAGNVICTTGKLMPRFEKLNM